MPWPPSATSVALFVDRVWISLLVCLFAGLLVCCLLVFCLMVFVGSLFLVDGCCLIIRLFWLPITVEVYA